MSKTLLPFSSSVVGINPVPGLQPMRLLGYWLICFALATIILAFYPLVKMELVYQIRSLKHQYYTVDTGDILKYPALFSGVRQKSDLEILTPVDRNFSLVIPKIGLNSKVFSQVDPVNQDQYDKVLSQGLAHSLGSSLPGEKGTVYIFGHSADLPLSLSQVNDIFYLLHKLKTGDQVNLFYNGWRYVYEVDQAKIITSQDFSFLDNNSTDRLVLQTCWPPGTTWQRLVVEAKPVYSN